MYAIDITFKTGEQIFRGFAVRNDTTFLPADKYLYLIDKRLINFVRKLIKTRGVSTCNDEKGKIINFR
jgi:hypothetical protein